MNLYNFKRIFILSNGNKNNSCSERKKETFFYPFKSAWNAKTCFNTLTTMGATHDTN